MWSANLKNVSTERCFWKCKDISVEQNQGVFVCVRECSHTVAHLVAHL